LENVQVLRELCLALENVQDRKEVHRGLCLALENVQVLMELYLALENVQFH
jgi:hypothetical protein